VIARLGGGADSSVYIALDEMGAGIARTEGRGGRVVYATVVHNGRPCVGRSCHLDHAGNMPTHVVGRDDDGNREFGGLGR
jgi:hypothetical protein